MTRPDGPLGEFLDEYLTTPLSKHNDIHVTEPRVQLENNSQKDTLLRNVKTGDQNLTFENGRYTLATTASGTSTDGLETANLAEYDPGLKGSAGLFVRKDDDPVGFAEWGYGGDVYNDGLYWRLEADGSLAFVREKDGVRTTIGRELWTADTDLQPVQDANENDVGVVTGFDPLDGTGNSGYEIATPFSTLFGVDMVLYGGGGFAPWVSGTDRSGRVRKLYPFVYKPDGEEILSQFNAPIFGRLDNDGAATTDSMILTERQFLEFGEGSPPRRETPHVASLTPAISSPENIFVFRRDDASGPTRADIAGIQLLVDNRAHVWVIARADVTNSPTWERPRRDLSGNRVAATETSLEVAEDAAVDAASGVALDGGIFPGGQGANVTVSATSLSESPFIRDEPVAVMVEPLTNSDVTEVEAVIRLSEGL